MGIYLQSFIINILLTFNFKIMRTLFVFIILLATLCVYSQSNYNVIKQEGDLQKATVTQLGLKNTSDVYQTNKLHEAVVNQTGANNTSEIDQFRTVWDYYFDVATRATVNQTGSKNTSKIYQYKGTYGGNTNWSLATVTQISPNGSVGNIAEIDQNVNDYATASIYQNGYSNLGKTKQVSNTSWATIYQDGINNEGIQYLWTTQSYADIKQLGNNNKGYQTTLTPPVGKSKFWIYQLGNNNFSDQDIQGTDWGYADGNNTMTSDQYGNNNYSAQYMLGGDNTAVVKQVGDYNDNEVQYNPAPNTNVEPSFDAYYMQYQNGYFNFAKIDLDGSYNHTAQYQLGDHNWTYMYIRGDKNNSAQQQEGNWNKSDIYIYGNNNYAMTKQVEDTDYDPGCYHNIASIIQGTANLPVKLNCAGIDQDGQGNQAFIYEYSNSNYSNIVQMGNNNYAYDYQK